MDFLKGQLIIGNNIIYTFAQSYLLLYNNVLLSIWKSFDQI